MTTVYWLGLGCSLTPWHDWHHARSSMMASILESAYNKFIISKFYLFDRCLICTEHTCALSVPSAQMKGNVMKLKPDSKSTSVTIVVRTCKFYKSNQLICAICAQDLSNLRCAPGSDEDICPALITNIILESRDSLPAHRGVVVSPWK